MTIMTASSGDFRDDEKGMHNATIKMIGTERLFLINDGSVENALISVMFNELNLQGSATKMNDGGLIYNREALNIQYSRLMGGNAVRGGAIYNAGILSDAQKTAGIVLISNSILQSNKADQGAVIYTEMPIYNISHSVIRDNEVAASGTGALIFTQTGFTDATIGTALLTRTSGIRNSTIFHNKGGYVANIREGMIFNNVTMIKNAAGLYLQAANWNVPASGTTTTSPVPSAYVSNNIIVDNNSKNCAAAANTTTVVQSNLTTAECGVGLTERPNIMWMPSNPTHKLIAGGVNDEGVCAAPPAAGLLCPYYTPKDQMLGFFRPRLLMSYSKLSDSLIVNKGRIYSDGTNIGLASCEATDQRGKSRSGYDELCDLGAVELIIDRSAIPIVGQDILFGETAKFNIVDSLMDGELVDPASCKAILGKELNSQGQPWQAGCLDIQQTQTPSKGKLTLDQDGNVTYVPNNNWHGADMFNLRVMTTTTRLNDVSNYYINIPTTIVQEPPNNFQNKTVNVSGGSSGLGAIFMLLGLVGLRRLKA